jgi:hypothetical protein
MKTSTSTCESECILSSDLGTTPRPHRRSSDGIKRRLSRVPSSPVIPATPGSPAGVETPPKRSAAASPSSSSKSGFLRYYEEHHVALDFVFGAMKALLSDIISQAIHSSHHQAGNTNGDNNSDLTKLSVNWQSVYYSLIISSMYMTPILIVFFSYLGRSKLSKPQKVFVDQFLFAPMYTAGIIALRLLFIGSLPLSQIPAQVVSAMPRAMMYGWLFWIPSKIILHEYIDNRYHLLLSQVLSLFWNTALSCII